MTDVMQGVRILEVAEEDVYLHWMDIRRAFRDSAAVGALRPTHLRGYKEAG